MPEGQANLRGLLRFGGVTEFWPPSLDRNPKGLRAGNTARQGRFDHPSWIIVSMKNDWKRIFAFD
jgi:hypothetical protein